MYPFLFWNQRTGKFHVKVAKSFDYTYAYTSWMHDADLPEETLRPDVDLEDSSHTFESENEALCFIKNWWANHEVE